MSALVTTRKSDFEDNNSASYPKYPRADVHKLIATYLMSPAVDRASVATCQDGASGVIPIAARLIESLVWLWIASLALAMTECAV
jgi:hypothetical protein